MAYFNRRLTGKRSVSAESLCLLVVVAAAVVTAYWAARTIGIDLSPMENAAAALGMSQSVAETHQVGYSKARVEATPPPSAPHCQAGEQPAYLNGIAALHQQIGSAMGTPLECEHADGALGNTVQHTSAGLAAYDSQRNTDTFTDGWHHWALTPNGVVAWEGTSAEPPQTTASAIGAELANQERGSPQAAAVNDDDRASVPLVASPPQSAAENEDNSASEPLADSPDDSSPEALSVNSDDGAADTEAANQDDASSEVAAVVDDDGVSKMQDDGSAQATTASEDDSADAVTDDDAGDQS